MGNFCKNCGRENVGNTAFCTFCGAKMLSTQTQPQPQQPRPQPTPANINNQPQRPVQQQMQRQVQPQMQRPVYETQPQPRRCSFCGAVMTGNSNFCSQCGRVVTVGAPMQNMQYNNAPQYYQNPQVNYKKVSSPIGAVFSGIGVAIKGFFKSFTKPKALLAMLLSATVWFVLILLPRLDIDNPIIKFLSFLTFAEGGHEGTVVQRIGGFCGKGTIAATVCSLFMGGGKQLIRGFSRMGKSLKNTSHYGILIFGIGISPLVYRFISGGISYDFFGKSKPDTSAAVIAVMGILLSVMASGSQSGWIFNLARSWTSKKQKGVRRPRESKASALLIGLSIGWVIAIPMFAFLGNAPEETQTEAQQAFNSIISADLRMVPYFICLGFIVLGILLNLIIRPRKAVQGAL